MELFGAGIAGAKYVFDIDARHFVERRACHAANAPRLSDISTMRQLLQSFGAEISVLNKGLVIAMSSHGLDNWRADYDIVRKMRIKSGA